MTLPCSIDDCVELADEWLSRTEPAELPTMNTTQLSDLIREARKIMPYLGMAIGIAEAKRTYDTVTEG